MEALDALGELGRQRLGATPPAARRTPTSTSPGPTAVVLGNEAHGLDAAVDARLDGHVHDPDGRARRVAERRHGRHRALLRVGAAAVAGASA